MTDPPPGARAHPNVRAPCRLAEVRAEDWDAGSRQRRTRRGDGATGASGETAPPGSFRETSDAGGVAPHRRVVRSRPLQRTEVMVTRFRVGRKPACPGFPLRREHPPTAVAIISAHFRDPLPDPLGPLRPATIRAHGYSHPPPRWRNVRNRPHTGRGRRCVGARTDSRPGEPSQTLESVSGSSPDDLRELSCLRSRYSRTCRETRRLGESHPVLV